jgi:hypothetical protein
MPKKKKPARRRRQKLVGIKQALKDVEKLELDLKRVKKTLKMMPHTWSYGEWCPGQDKK